MATAAPLVAGTSYVTDSGLETDLIYNHRFDLPAFAAFVLLRDPAGRRALEPVLRRARGGRRGERSRQHPRDADVACQQRLGTGGRLERVGRRRRQPRRPSPSSGTRWARPPRRRCW